MLLRPMEAAELLGLGRSRIYSMLAEGIIPSVRIGERSIRIPVDALRQWVEGQYKEAEGAEEDEQEGGQQ